MATKRTALRVFLVALLAVVAGLALSLTRGSSAGPPRELLPDLDQATPWGLSVRRHESRFVLTFGSAVLNVGSGPLIIHGTRVRPHVMNARQIIERRDGSTVTRPLGRLLRYEHAETHSHWHLERFDRYEIRFASDPTRVVRGTKMGFCLGDRYEASGSDRLPGKPANRRWTHACGRGRTELRRLGQGISVGYGDDYRPYLEGQFVSLAGLASGRYLLVHVADPRRYLREETRANNAASVLFRLLRPAGEPPRVTVLSRCPGSAICSA